MTEFAQGRWLDRSRSEPFWHQRRNEPRVGNRDRYRVEMLENNGEPVLRVTDQLACSASTPPLFEWRGELVRQMQRCGVPGGGFFRSRVRHCDKSFVQHLALAAASAELAGERSRARVRKPDRVTDQPVVHAVSGQSSWKRRLASRRNLREIIGYLLAIEFSRKEGVNLPVRVQQGDKCRVTDQVVVIGGRFGHFVNNPCRCGVSRAGSTDTR